MAAGGLSLSAVVVALAGLLERLVTELFRQERPLCREALVAVTSVLQRLADVKGRRLLQCRVHEQLTLLLSCDDANVLPCALRCLLQLSQPPPLPGRNAAPRLPRTSADPPRAARASLPSTSILLCSLH